MHNSLAVSFRAKTGQPSGPGALSDLIFLSLSYAMEGVTVIEFKVGISLLREKDGIELVSSRVNTLVKKSLNNIDLSLSEKTIEPSDFLRISTAGRDLKRELTYFQKCLELLLQLETNFSHAYNVNSC